MKTKISFEQKPLSESASEPIGAAVGGIVDVAAGLLGALIGAKPSNKH